jgi:hypothetical protein
MASSSNVGSGIFLNNGFAAAGDVRLAGAQIGFMVCDGGRFHNSRGQALNVNGARIRGGVFLRQGFAATGEVNLVGVHIGGSLECTGGSFQNPAGSALNADTADIEGSVLLKTGFSATGEVTLRRAHIGSNLECYGGSFANPGGRALNGAGAEIKGDVFLYDSSCAEGQINLELAHIEGGLVCTDGRFRDLHFAAMTVKRAFIWQRVQSFTTLDLRGASVWALSDDEESWPANGNLHADHFVYETISHGPTGAPARLRWLSRQREFARQPYRQLAKFLHDLGDDAGAKQVLFTLEGRARAEERKRIAKAPLRWLRLSGDNISRATVGYGVYPGWALRFLCAMVALGWILYLRAAGVGAMAPTDKDAYQEFHRNNGHASASYTPFTPLIYALETCIPLVKLGQDDRWQPDPNPQRQASNFLESPIFLRWFRWFTILVGWLLATFFVAAVTGIIKSSD